MKKQGKIDFFIIIMAVMFTGAYSLKGSAVEWPRPLMTPFTLSAGTSISPLSIFPKNTIRTGFLDFPNLGPYTAPFTMHNQIRSREFPRIIGSFRKGQTSSFFPITPTTDLNPNSFENTTAEYPALPSFESLKKDSYTIGPALIELNPLTLRIIGYHFWGFHDKSYRTYPNRYNRRLSNNSWELSVVGRENEPTLSIHRHHQSMLPADGFGYLFDLKSEELRRQPFQSGLAKDPSYISNGMYIHGLKGSRMRLPEQIKDFEYVSDPTYDYNFLLAITQKSDSLNLWEIPLDDTDSFIGTYNHITSIDNPGSGSPLNYANVSYGQILWDGQLREVLYICKDEFQDFFDEVVMVDFYTGEVLHSLSSGESEIPLKEPFFLPQGEIADSVFWINPQDVKCLEGRLFMIGSLCCRPCETKIKKYISIDGGETYLDAEKATGPVVPVGTPLFFKLIVSNTRIFRMVNITLKDSDYPVDTCLTPEVLNRGESFECVIGPFEAQIGRQTNTSTVEAKPCFKRCCITLRDEDKAYYYGGGPQIPINIEKSTNGQDADTPPGPSIPVGNPVNWIYAVTNTGTSTLTDVIVTDSEHIPVICPKNTLAAGESMICKATGIAQSGQYMNTGEVRAKDPNGNILCDSDFSHYFGASPEITIEKITNCFDADDPPGTSIPVGNSIKWTYVVTNNSNGVLTDITVTDDQGTQIYCPKAQLAAGESMVCSANGLAKAGQYANIATVTAKDPNNNDLINKDPSHYFGSSPGITIKKITNGYPADYPPGPSIPVGDPVQWFYVVTNTGEITLTNIIVTDNREVEISCPKTQLAAGEYMICSANGFAEAGQYANVATVTAKDPDNKDLIDKNPSHYFGSSPGISIEKNTNCSNADYPPGPSIQVGNPITWAYVITNTGRVPLTNVTVTDSQGVSLSCPKTELAPDEFMVCMAKGTARPGPYANIGTVTAQDPNGNLVIDVDPSHYFGSSPGISIEKNTNCANADDPPGPFIPVGNPIRWAYVVTNTGEVPLTNVTVLDNQGVPLSCPKTELAAGEFMICIAYGTAQPGPYANVGTVTALDPEGNLAFDADPSHYYGSLPEINIDKLTNGSDADNPPGPFIIAGTPVEWTYIVTNTSTLTLMNITVTDSQGITVSCPETELAPDEFMICSAQGTAWPGPHANLSLVTAQDPDGNYVFDEDPSHYFASLPGLDLEKLTNGSDADNPPGPSIQAGTEIEWTYIVTNTGDGPLTNVTVRDNQGVQVSCPKTELAEGEFMVCTANGTARPGPYGNIGSVTAQDPNGGSICADDPGHYYGSLAGIDLEKFTNGCDADDPPGPSIPVGDPITWSYIITNISNAPITNIFVMDNQGVSLSCPKTELAPGEFMICKTNGTARLGPYENIGSVVAEDPNGGLVCDEDASHYFGTLALIDLQKETNGNDADDPPGPSIPVGNPIEWTYIVTNTSAVTLSNITVRDDQAVEVSCPKTELTPGEFMICTADGSAQPGPYANLAIVTANDPEGGLIFDEDPGHYFGSTFGIDLQKETNGVDADDPPGPSVPVGYTIEWTYTVTNTGSVTLSNITVRDNRGVQVSCPKTDLAAGEFMACTASGIAQPGLYADLGIVTAKSPEGDDIFDEDPSHYFGFTLGILIEKATNGQDADEQPGPSIPAGDPIEWTYVVTNTGNVTLTEVTAADTQGVSISCPQTELGANETMICTANGTAIAGQYVNVGIVTAKDQDNNDLIDEDPSHYFGTTAGIEIEKATNGQDADNRPGPIISIGDPVNWTYVVTNTGDVALTSVRVVDNQGVSVSCPKTELTAGESMTCTANGTALPDQYANTATVMAKDSDNNDLMDSDPSHYFGESPLNPCLELIKSIDGPYRTSDNLFLADRIIPVAYTTKEKAFYFLVKITVKNCGGKKLTGVEVVDTFSNEAYPFETSDPGNVTITPAPNDKFEKEKLTWSVGSLGAGQNRTLEIKVGTERNPSGRLEPTSTPQTIFYNGQNDDPNKRPTATADGGLSVSVEAVTLTNGEEISCAGSDGQWAADLDKCTQIITNLPITKTGITQ